MKFKYKLIYVIMFAIFLEIVVFNYSYIRSMFDKNIEKNVSYTLKDMEKINWTESNNGIISQLDPMLIISDINTYVKDFELTLSMDKNPPFILCYYTKNNEDIFNDKMSVAVTNIFSDKNNIKVNSYINDLRLDIGDNAGLSLSNLSVIINPVKFDFNIARVITVILIYLIGAGLFFLQRSPIYDVLLNQEEGIFYGKDNES